MMLKNYLGILGDPAKSELYDTEFYRILKWDESQSGFHLLGASEDGLSRKDYLNMFNRFSPHLRGLDFPPIERLSDPKIRSYRTRIGLFPSSPSHLIRGPSFSFAPYPINSNSRFVKWRAKFLKTILTPFLPFKVRSLAYSPMGGKAATKTSANPDFSLNRIASLFYQLRSKNTHDWYYLEAGSGENILSKDQIDLVLSAQYRAIKDLPANIGTPVDFDLGQTRIIIPRSIYGGGIRSVEQLEQILIPNKGETKLVPELVIVGNISEESVDITYKLLDKVAEINDLPVLAIDNLQ